LRADQNESVHLIECKGTLAQDVEGALIEMEARGKAARSQRSLYHASISPEAATPLKGDEIRQAVDHLEERLGLHGQPRVVVQHRKNHREHIHVVWSRIEADTGNAVSNSWNYRLHEQAARELEAMFGHRPIQNSMHHRKWDERRTSTDYEQRQSERSGIGIASVTSELSRFWEMSRTGSEFKRHLEEAGYALVRGDRRVYVVIDRNGNAHSLARRIEGADTKAVRSKLRDLSLDSLPSVQEGRSLVRRRSAPRPLRAKFALASHEVTRPMKTDDIAPRAIAARARVNFRAMLVPDAALGTMRERARPMIVTRPLLTYRAARAAIIANFASRIAQAIRFSQPDELDAVLERLAEERAAALDRLRGTSGRQVKRLKKSGWKARRQFRAARWRNTRRQERSKV
jgi:hypothetical protein